MKLYHLVFTLVGLMSVGCSDDDGCQDAETDFQFAESSQLIRIDNTELGLFRYEISEGNKRVFKMDHAGAQCDDTFDDEWGERIVFEVDQTVSSFRLEGSDLIEAQCYYNQWGAWVNSNPLVITSGLIEGSKLDDNSWSINLSINLSAQNALGSNLVAYSGTYERE